MLSTTEVSRNRYYVPKMIVFCSVEVDNSELFQDKEVAAIGMNSPHLIHNRIFEADRLTFPSVKRAILAVFKEQGDNSDYRILEKCDSSIDLNNTLKNISDKNRSSSNEIDVVDYHTILGTATCLDLDDYVVECIFADFQKTIPIVIRKSGAVSVLSVSESVHADTRFLDIVQTREAIVSNPNAYIETRLPGISNLIRK